ncbi:MAG: TIGR00730 family Rossman fold protein [Candidatus Babeliaceae bacterium]
MRQFIQNITKALAIGAHFFKTTLQIIYGAWKISRLPQPIVSIFGGSRLKKDSIYVQQAQIVARMLVDRNLSVITGGGPGIMEAATCGASHEQKRRIRTMGIGVVGLKGEEGFNPCVKDSIMLDYFFARKYLLINFSLGFIIFPGGFGTMDELSELLTLMQTGKLKRAPVILIGSEYWKDYLAWVEVARHNGLLVSKETHLITVTDDLKEAVDILASHCDVCMIQGITHL